MQQNNIISNKLKLQQEMYFQEFLQNYTTTSL